MKKFLIPIFLILFQLSAYADGGSIIPGTCPLNGGDVNEINYAVHDHAFELEEAIDSDSESLYPDFEVSVTTHSYYYFSAASRSHTLRRHWNGIRHAGESIPSIFNHNFFPGFFVVESLVFETINNAVALHTPPCSTRNVNGHTYAAYTLSLTGGVIVKVIINLATHVIVTAYPTN